MEKKYKQFWDWFVQDRTRFERHEISDQSVELIDQKINTLGNFAWEIGPGQLKSFSLTISPGGDCTLLPVTKKIISYAPSLNNWEFHYAKPIKEWEHYFNVTISGKKIGVDISNWEYILFKSAKGTYDIQITLTDLPPAILAEKNEVLYGIIEMVLDSIIGEEKRLERINEIEFVKGRQIEKGTSSILNLRQHLDILP